MKKHKTENGTKTVRERAERQGRDKRADLNEIRMGRKEGKFSSHGQASLCENTDSHFSNLVLQEDAAKRVAGASDRARQPVL